MKNTLLLLTLILATFSIAKETAVTIHAVDAYTNEPAVNVVFKILDNNGDLLYSDSTNANGEIIIIADYKRAKTITIHNDTERYLFNPIDLFFGKYDYTERIYMYPNDTYENEISKLEDSIYGKRKLVNIDSLVTAHNDENYKVKHKYGDAIFKGGTEAMTDFIISNFIYPEFSRIMGDQGKVYIQFVVLNTGEIVQVKILRKVVPLLDAEARRIIRLMPNWNPGFISEDVKVNTRCIMPITFSLK